MKVSALSDLLGMPPLVRYLTDVEALLEDAIGVENQWISIPARRVVGGGGKRLRPIITIAAAAAGGAAVSEPVLRGAAALELVHVGSLVHDDIMDAAKSRRGIDTVNAREGINHAVLIGDFLLARAGELASTISAEVSHALATAIVQLCDGQSLETGSLFNIDRSRTAYEKSIEGKTASLLRASCRIGALASDLPPSVVDAMAAYGAAFGMAFQIIDDILDLISTSDAMGKPVGNDLREGVYTLPVLLALEGDRGSSLRKVLARGIDQSSIDMVVETALTTGAIAEALSVATGYNQKAMAALDNLEDVPVVAGLRRLPDAYCRWAISEKAEARYYRLIGIGTDHGPR